MPHRALDVARSRWKCPDDRAPTRTRRITILPTTSGVRLVAAVTGRVLASVRGEPALTACSAAAI